MNKYIHTAVRSAVVTFVLLCAFWAVAWLGRHSSPNLCEFGRGGAAVTADGGYRRC